MWDNIYPKDMTAIDLKKQLKPYKSGWVAIKGDVVIASAKDFKTIHEKVEKLKVKTKDVFLVPAAESYFGFVTSINA
jgi:hypothetical protein